MHSSLASARRRVFPLLDTAPDVDVFALLIVNCIVGNLVVEDQAVPIGVGLKLGFRSGEEIRLTQASIRDLGARGEMAQLWFPVAGPTRPGLTSESWSEEIACMWRFSRNHVIYRRFPQQNGNISRLAYGFRNFENYRLRVKVLCS